MDALLNNSVNWARVLRQPDNLTAIMGNENFRTRVFGNNIAWSTLLSDATAINSISATITTAVFANDLADVPTAWTSAVANYTIMNVLCSNDASWGVFSANTTYMENIIDSRNAMRAVGNNNMRCLSFIADSPAYRARVVATSDAGAGLAQASTIGQRGSRVSSSGNSAATVISGRFWFTTGTTRADGTSGQSGLIGLENLIDLPATASVSVIFAIGVTNTYDIRRFGESAQMTTNPMSANTTLTVTFNGIPC